MKEVTINGKRKLCYIVKRGEVNDIVVTLESLADVDIRRFHKMETEGGELMRVMRDTTLDNGMNALKMYENLLRTVQVEKKTTVVTNTESNILDVANDVNTNTRAPATKKRGRGRPKKA